MQLLSHPLFTLIGISVTLSSLFFLTYSKAKGEANKEKRQVTAIPLCGWSGQSVFSFRQHNSYHSRVTPAAFSLPAPALMEGIGISELTISTSSDSAQLYFNQGLSMLHNFWEFEAFRAFRQAALLDSTAAMPQWGVAYTLLTSNYGQEYKEEKDQALKHARALKSKATEQESLYNDALFALEEAENKDEERKAFKEAMEKLISYYPDDVEARLILWQKLNEKNDYAQGKDPEEYTLYAQLLLENLLLPHPEHPAVHHFYIHQMEDCCPEKALKSAELLARMTPNSGHMVHMPAHIFYRLGNYHKAREALNASFAVDSAYMATYQIPQFDVWNYVHNLYYQQANSAEMGRYREAKKWHSRLLQNPAHSDSTDKAAQKYYVSFLTRHLRGLSLYER